MANNEKNITIIEEAVVELQSIVNAADKSAKDKMAKQLPKEFEKLLKEELEKNKKESVNESVKDVTKEPIIEGKKTDDDKESLNEMEEIDLTELSINDIEEAYNEASSSDEFEVSADDININDVEKELDEMQGMTMDVDNMQQEANNPNDPFDKIKNLHKMLGEMIQDNEQTNEMHEKVPRGATAPAEVGHNTNPKGIVEDVIDEAVSPDLLTSAMGILSVLAASGGIAALQHKLQGTAAGQALAQLGSAASDSVKGGSLPGMGEGIVTENEEVIDEVDKVDDEGKEEVDETAGIGKSHALNRTVGNENLPASSPRKDSTQREFQRESVEKFIVQKGNMEKRMASLINENKKMTKRVNESKVDAKKFKALSENQDKFKDTLVKYRGQLSEMAIFNTNLASVNSILVNENLALTSEDKKSIINKFKNVKSITESEDTYKSVLNEMQEAKKTIVETVEEKVTTTIDKSSSDKVVEQTAFVNENEHIKKIKDVMKYVNNHGNNRILS